GARSKSSATAGRCCASSPSSALGTRGGNGREGPELLTAWNESADRAAQEAPDPLPALGGRARAQRDDPRPLRERAVRADPCEDAARRPPAPAVPARGRADRARGRGGALAARAAEPDHRGEG